MEDDAGRAPKYISNDSSLGGDEFYDAVDTIEKRMSTVSFVSARSTNSMAPSPAAAELMAALASSGGSRKVDIGASMEEFASTTANEGPPGGSLGIATFRNSGTASNSVMRRGGNPFDLDCNLTASGKSPPSPACRTWPPPRSHQPSRMVVLDISSSETTPTTTPGGGRGKGENPASATWNGSQSTSTSTPHLPPPRTTNMNPFVTKPPTAPSPDNPFATPSTTMNPFANVCEEALPSATVASRPAAPASAPGAAAPGASLDKARPPPLPPRRTIGNLVNASVPSPKRKGDPIITRCRRSSAPSISHVEVPGPIASAGVNAAPLETTGNSQGSQGNAEQSQFMVINKDTGQVFDVREMGQHLSAEDYNLLPSRADLIALERQRAVSSLNNSKPASPSTRSSMSSVAASVAAAVGNASSNREKARSLGNRVRKGFGMVAAAAGVAGGGSSSGGGAGTNPGDVGQSNQGEAKGATGSGSSGIGAAARSAIAGIRVSLKGKEALESLAGLIMLQEMKAHDGPIWTVAFNQSGKFMATAGEDKRIILHHVGNVTEDPYSDSSGNGGKTGILTTEAANGEAITRLGCPEQDHAKGDPTPAPKSAAGGIGLSENGGESGATANGGEGVRNGCRRGSGRRTDVPVFMNTTPCQVWCAHKADILSLSWSRNDFLLSASLDTTVRLWHTTQPACLHAFKHNDIVTAVDFHPLYEHFFLSGCFDKRVRVWNIRDGHVQQWEQASDMVTSVKFSLDGQMIVVGLYMGQVLFYQTEGMRYFTQIECRNRRGPRKRGRKVTGIAFYSTAREDESSYGGSTGGGGRRSPSISPGRKRSSDETPRRVEPSTGVRSAGGAASNHVPEQVLVSTNDSRIRLYNTDDFGMNAKYKGLTNDTLQIQASFSEDGKQIISGSENGKVYVWSTGVVTKPATPGLATLPDAPSSPLRPDSPVSTTQKDTNRCHESFDASGGDPKIVTQALFVPEVAARGCVMALRGKISKEVADAGGYCGCMILAVDYDGCIRVYCKSDVVLG